MNPIDRIEPLRAELARVTAEREAEFRRSDSELAAAAQKESALRARVAELEATRAKHPDTDIVDWLEDNTAVLYCAGLYDSSPNAAVEIPGIGVFVGETLRAAIDAARKQPPTT